MRARMLLLPLAVLGAGAAQAEEAAIDEGLTCQVSGYDVVLLNGGPEAIGEGTEVVWNVPFARKDGRHVLTRPLEAGGTVFLSGVLGASYLDPKKPCTAALAPEAAGEQPQ